MQFAPADCSRLPRLVELDSSWDGMTLQERFEALAKDNFLGVPIAGFEASGREQLHYLVRAGQNPSSKLVDLGCGVLRAG